MAVELFKVIVECGRAEFQVTLINQNVVQKPTLIPFDQFNFWVFVVVAPAKQANCDCR